MTTTKAAKVVAALENGTELTAKQIESRYNVKNARALISSLVCRDILFTSISVLARLMDRPIASTVWVLHHVLLLLLAIVPLQRVFKLINTPNG